MIQFTNVSKHFGNSVALQDVNFHIEKGSFVYMIGPTGSGKTTVFRLIQRDLLPTQGSIMVGEWEIPKLPKDKIPHLRRKVGVIFQDLKLLMDRTVMENIILPLQFSGVAESSAQAKAKELLMEVGLVDKEDKFPLQLSGGERQRVAIARALMSDPEVLLADEPTGNLDMQTSFQILDLLDSINKKGTTILMATHNEEILNKLTKRVLVLANGALLEDRMPKEKEEKKEHKKSKE